MSDFTTTFDNESFINSEIGNNENIKSSLNAEEVIENSLDVVEETTSKLNSQSGMNSLLDEPMIHRYEAEDSDNIDVHVDNEKYKISATLKQIRFKTLNDFPEVGSEKLIYIAEDTKTLYGWDEKTNEYFKLVEDVDIPSKLSEFENDVGFIDKNVANLVNYYTKAQTYTKQEISDLINKSSSSGGYDDTEIREDIRELETSLNKTSGDVSKLEENILTLETNISNNGEHIKALEINKADNSVVEELKNKKADKSEIPYVGNFITNTVDNLINYYKKSETYSQAEVRQLVSTIPKFEIEVVNSLPENPKEKTIYLLLINLTQTGNLYDEYIYVNGLWEKLGTQTIDLSGYVKEDDLKNYVTDEELANKGYLTDIPNEYVTADELESKGYLTSLPIKVAFEDQTNIFTEKNLFYKDQEFGGAIVLNENGSINGLLNQKGSNFQWVAPFIKVDNENGQIVIGSSYVSKVSSPNIIQAQGLTDGTTTKTMTEILAGGGGTNIVWREWT